MPHLQLLTEQIGKSEQGNRLGQHCKPTRPEQTFIEHTTHFFLTWQTIL